MQLLLTDRLACPRCGPTFGLILLADRLVDRRVHEGTLGCPNCRDSFAVSDGFADLRAPPRGQLGSGLAGSGPPGREDAGAEAEEAGRITALLGIPRGPGTVVMVGAPARFGRFVAESVPDLDVVLVDADTSGWPEHPRLSRIVSWPGLPFFSGVMRGAVVDGRLGKAFLFEAARVIAPKCRTVVVEAPEDASDVLEEAGLVVLAAEGGTVVAARG
jgi:uncharacterized protein YbaR (Trm112 family)